jgi:iron-sulfur cluster assembly accessory protein
MIDDSVKMGNAAAVCAQRTTSSPSRDGATVAIDPVTVEMMKGSEVDFVDELMRQSFQIKNPNAVASRGCMVSFSV